MSIRESHALLRLLPLLLTLVLVAPVVAVAGCGSGNEPEAAEASAEREESQFELGEPLGDSSLAAVVTSEYGVDTLTAGEFRSQISRILAQFPQMQGDPEQARELRRTLVEQFALTHALAGEVQESGMSVDLALLEEHLGQIRGQFDSEEAYREALAEQEMTEEDLRSGLREQIEQQQWQESVVESAEEPTEPEVEAFREEQAEQVRAQHILFLTQRPDPEIRSLAETVLDSAKSNLAPFEDLARRHSDDGTAAQGGDLNFFSRGEMVEPFADAAFALRDSGDVTDDLVRTQYGYHIIRLTGRRTSEKMDTSEARQRMMRRRQQEALMDALDRLREKVVLRINPEIVDADLNPPAE